MKIIYTTDRVGVTSEILVDDWNYDYLNQFKWYVGKTKRSRYAIRVGRDERGKKVTIRMHREIMNCPPKLKVDHKDHNTINNQEYNLRICSNRQNCKNKVSLEGSSSIFLGVSANPMTKNTGIGLRNYFYWKSSIQIGNGKLLHLGSFKTERFAALVFNEGAKHFHGEFANLNIIENVTEAEFELAVAKFAAVLQRHSQRSGVHLAHSV